MAGSRLRYYSKKVNCSNCDQEGHTWRNCPKPKVCPLFESPLLVVSFVWILISCCGAFASLLVRLTVLLLSWPLSVFFFHLADFWHFCLFSPCALQRKRPCVKCGMMGHSENRCPHDVCYRCMRMGHRVKVPMMSQLPPVAVFLPIK